MGVLRLTFVHLFLLLIGLTEGKKPNILLMIADDLGIGDIGCFGNTTLRTPNIDSIAREGVQLNQHLTASSLCTPSRSAFLTGRYPIRSGMAARHPLRVQFLLASSTGLPTTEVTFAKLAKQAGYTTGLIGKWHQGWSKHRFNDFHYHPQNHGFDYFYGVPLSNLKDFGDDGDAILADLFPYITQRLIAIVLVVAITFVSLYRARYIGLIFCSFILAMTIFTAAVAYLFVFNQKLLGSVVYRNFDLVEEPIDLETQMRKEVAEGQEFLQLRKADDKPFLLVMSWIHVHTYLAPAKEYLGRSQHGKYGDAVEELDWAVGEMTKSLIRLDMADDTLVYFTSDNGGHLEERNIHGEMEGGYNGIYKGGKGHDSVDGSIRVPTVMKWPGRIRAGSVSNEPTSLMDVLPTLASIIDVPVPSDRVIDGKNILPLLQGQTTVSPHEFLFHYCGHEIHAVRFRPRDGSTTWKLCFKEPDYIPGTQMCNNLLCSCSGAIVRDPPYLYDMTSDPGENRPINATEHPDIYQKIMKALKDHENSVVSVENRFTFWHVMWKPWLQMCCNSNYPTCECQDEKFTGKFTN